MQSKPKSTNENQNHKHSPARNRIHGGTVPKNAVTAGGNDERHRYFGVVLEKLFVFAFVVEFVALMLSESVDALVVIKRTERAISITPVPR